MYPLKLILLCVYFLTYLIPRKRNRWVFGEAHGFNNNSKYLFIEVINNSPEIEAFWIGDSMTVKQLQGKGLPAYNRFSLYGIYLCITAKIYVVSWTHGDINFYLSGGAHVVNLWHGLAWKKCLWLEPKYAKYEDVSFIRKITHILKAPIVYFPPKLVLSTSPFYTDIYAKMFKVKKEQCVEDIYPRVRFMLKPKEDIIAYLEKYALTEHLELIKKLSSYHKVFLYAPTFRDTGEDFVASSGIDFHELNNKLVKTYSFLIVKFHPSTIYDSSRYDSLSNITFLSKKYDLNAIMPFTDVLISDYSTTLIDYMLLKKKMIAFIFDYDKYILTCRELLFDIKESLRGVPIAENQDELIELMFSEDMGIADIPQELFDRYWMPTGNLLERIKCLSLL